MKKNIFVTLFKFLLLPLRVIAPIMAIFGISELLYANQPLPGDAIHGFRLVQLSKSKNLNWHWDLYLEERYSYNPAHREVIVGAELLPISPQLQSGQTFWGYVSGPLKAVEESSQGNIVQGMQRVNVSVLLNVRQIATNEISFFLYEPGGNVFLSSTFPYLHNWLHPENINLNHPEVNYTESLPDLIILSGVYEPGGPLIAPGTKVRFSFLIKNAGTAPAYGFIRVSGPGNCSGGFPDGLAPGATKIATVDYPLYSKGVTYQLIFTVDPDNIIKESNEDNNNSFQFTIKTSY